VRQKNLFLSILGHGARVGCGGLLEGELAMNVLFLTVIVMLELGWLMALFSGAGWLLQLH
jgi:hypothetical protein